MTAEAFFATARERYDILTRRQVDEERVALGEQPIGPPWTDDPIYAGSRFCNVFREDDRVTRWMRANLTEPLGDDLARQYMAAVVFRWFNKIETGELLKPLLLGDWDTEEARRLLKERVARKETILGAAYMIKSPLRVNKVDGLLDCIDQVRARHMDRVAGIQWYHTLQRAHEELLPFPYLGPFMAYQMVCDMRHSPLLADATDTMTWTCPGPGSARGLSRVLHGEVGHFDYNNARQREEMVAHMGGLLALASHPDYWPEDWPRWELATVQHWLCEFDKYERVRLGEGRAKQRFTPHNAGDQ
jgi:hypothetical protein